MEPLPSIFARQKAGESRGKQIEVEKGIKRVKSFDRSKDEEDKYIENEICDRPALCLSVMRQ